MRSVLTGLALVFGISLSAGCLATKGAVALTPQLAQDSRTLWIYLDTNKSGATGVYRCVDTNEGPSCIKADLKR